MDKPECLKYNPYLKLIDIFTDSTKIQLLPKWTIKELTRTLFGIDLPADHLTK
jgi:hypothetical protein